MLGAAVQQEGVQEPPGLQHTSHAAALPLHPVQGSDLSEGQRHRELSPMGAISILHPTRGSCAHPSPLPAVLLSLL